MSAGTSQRKEEGRSPDIPIFVILVYSNLYQLYSTSGRYQDSLEYLGLYCIFSEYCSMAFLFSSALKGFWLYFDIWSEWM
jgi:hypothetical protein